MLRVNCHLALITYHLLPVLPYLLFCYVNLDCVFVKAYRGFETSTKSDLLKANSFAQSDFFNKNLAQRYVLKIIFKKKTG